MSVEDTVSEVDLHRPRCCENPTPEATWGMGQGTAYHNSAFITVWCTECGTDLVTLDPPSGGDRGLYVGRWDWKRDQTEREDQT